MSVFWKNNKNGLIGTILFHLMLVLLFIFLSFTAPPAEFPKPEGILIDFGDSETGLGDEEPESVENNTSNANNNSENIEEEILVQDDIETVAIENNNNTEDNVEEHQPEVNNNALYTGNNNTSEGNTNGDGNMGDPDGTNSDNYTGGGIGNGINYNLKGRSPVGKFPKPDYPPGNVYGKVVVNIKVDKYGKVIRVDIGKGTTTSDEGLMRAAKKAAWQVRFSNDFKSIEQTGTITYNFSLM